MIWVLWYYCDNAVTIHGVFDNELEALRALNTEDIYNASVTAASFGVRLDYEYLNNERKKA
jgi:hypothetical protein